MAIATLGTVKKVDEVVRHLHLVTQDRFSLVSEKVSGIPEDNFTINVELFRQTFTNVELLRQNCIVSKATSPGREPRSSDLHSDTLPLRHTLILTENYTGGFRKCSVAIPLLLDVSQR